ncbi:XRE family transcriptional regulator [Streptomyces sp. WAC01280]|uniref:XRE family transcriptional regulator n=1 Tax=Streptomyces sp. WAC01280 TaxID=2487424 RepID=UPI000F7BA820|nr:XRE family transcriptional regulator [Streptomyces sp. WAC01280]RSS57466.1 XRE family transcriptional regulator [Streptomyces sp. WAC01280]
MPHVRNEAFVAWMAKNGWTALELAKALNTVIRDVTQKTSPRGGLSEVTVRKWRSGETTWPQGKARMALEQVSGRSAADLGFVPPDRRKSRAAPEDPLLRRTFITAASAAGVAVLSGAAPSVGSGDVLRLRQQLDTVNALDDQRGGHDRVEKAALAGAQEAVGLQGRAATQRTRQRLFALAADFTATAAWSCVDARERTRARQHLDRALYLAGLAQDPALTMRVWNSVSMLAHQRGDHAEALAAGQAAKATAITRRDPLYASLAHARTAIAHAHLTEGRQALRALDLAAASLDKADLDRPRPSWIAFYGAAELHALTAIVRDRIGDAASAEAASFQALAVLPDTFRRNRALATVRLSLAQLHQGDIEQATATTAKVFDEMCGAPLPGRMRSLLGEFHRDLITLAPGSAIAMDWADRYRTEWSRP